MKTQCFFLRGLVRESGHWAGFLERFEAAFPHHEAVALDIPGCGRHFHEKSPSSIGAMKDFLRRDFLRLHNGQPAQFFALSLGAMIGLQWMQDHPKDFACATLVNTSLRGLSPFYRRLRPKNYLTILRLLGANDFWIREDKILQITSHNLARREELASEWAAIQKLHPVSRANAIRQIFAAAKFTPPKEKPEPRILLLSSYADDLVSYTCTEALAQLWNLPVHLHESAGHDLTLDAPDWVLSKLKEFYSG